MADSRFFSKSESKTLKELADLSQADIYLSEKCVLKDYSLIDDIVPMDLAIDGQIGVFNSVKHKDSLLKSKASACITTKNLLKYVPERMAVLIVSVPQKAYALISQKYYPIESNTVDLGFEGIHDTAKIGKNVKIGAYVSIGKNVEIGDDTVIGSNSSIGSGSVIGKNCQIHSNVTISHSIIKNNVKIFPGACIGKPGFGFYMDQDGALSIPQVGRVIIHDRAEIGSNTCIDRGSGHDTIIGPVTRIDNLVQIAHNVQIGMGSIIVSQVGIAGSTKIGNFCALGGQVGIADHVKIGDGVQVAGQSGVSRNIDPGQAVGGSPAVSVRDWQRQIATLKKISSKK